uniref:Uncharacterized protein n=1 Tax=consortium cosmid clone pGZ1 TaxID=397422 RepID=Q0MX94_9BACT|nr:unknown [consortium cosmid clone pGZ1]
MSRSRFPWPEGSVLRFAASVPCSPARFVVRAPWPFALSFLAPSFLALLFLALLFLVLLPSAAPAHAAAQPRVDFASFDCPQIAAEQARVDARIRLLAGRRDRAAQRDQARLGNDAAALREAALARRCDPAAVAPSDASVMAVRMPQVAIEDAASVPPAVILDGHLAFGSRSLALDGGRWFALPRVDETVLATRAPDGRFGPDDAFAVPQSTALAYELRGNELGRVVVATADAGTVGGVTSWAADPCAVAETSFLENRSGNPALPECLFVRAVHPALVLESSPLSAVLRSARRAGATVPVLYREIVYARYAPNGFVHVSLFESAADGLSEGDAVALARALAAALAPLATGQRMSAALPGSGKPPSVSRGS